MTTEIEGASVTIVKPRFNWLLVLAILALGLLVAVFAATILPTMTTRGAAQPVAQQSAVTSSQGQGPTLAEYAAGERNEATLPASLVDNPELMLAHRYSSQGQGPTLAEYAAGERNEATLPASLVDNPELMLAHRYIVVENRIDPDRDIGLMEFHQPE